MADQASEGNAAPAPGMRVPAGTFMPAVPDDIATEIESWVAGAFAGTFNSTFDKVSIQKDEPVYGHHDLSEARQPGLPDPLVNEVVPDPITGEQLRSVPVGNVDWVPLQPPRAAVAEVVPVKLQPMTGASELPGTLRFETLTRSADASARAEGVFHGTLASVLGPQVAANPASSAYALAVRALMVQDALQSGAVVHPRPRYPVAVYQAPLREWNYVAEEFRGAPRVPVLASDTSEYVSVLLTLMLDGGMGAMQWQIPGHDAMPAGARVWMPGGARRFLLLEEQRASPLEVQVGGAMLTLPHLSSFVDRLSQLLGPRAMAHAARSAASLARVYCPPGSADLDPTKVNFVPANAPALGAGDVALGPLLVAVAGGQHRLVALGGNGFRGAPVGRAAERPEAVLADVAIELNPGWDGDCGHAHRARGGIEGTIALRPEGHVEGPLRIVRVRVDANGVRVHAEDAWARLSHGLRTRVRHLRVREGIMAGGHDPHLAPAVATRFNGMRNVFGQVDGLSTLVAPALELDGLVAMLVRLCTTSSKSGTWTRRLSAAEWSRLMSVAATRIHLFTHRALYLSDLMPSRQRGQDGRLLRAVLPRRVSGAVAPVCLDATLMPYGSLECLEDGAWFRANGEDAEFVGYSVGGKWESGAEAGAAWPNEDHASRAAIDAALRLARALNEEVALGRPSRLPVVVPCSRPRVAHPFGYPLSVPVGSGHLRGEVVFGAGASLIFAGGTMPTFSKRRVVAPY